MNLEFYKYQATGNDFIIIDDRKQDFPLSSELIQYLCHRSFGIGADGLILLQNHQEHDFEMLFFNPDGSSGSMCGNGGRCIALFAYHKSITIDQIKFHAPDGVHTAKISKDDLGHFSVDLSMNSVYDIQIENDEFYVNTGAPHHVLFQENLHEAEIKDIAQKIRYSKKYQPNGVNVNFIELIDDQLFLRTYEKGVEDETLSCGTGVTASALAVALKNTIQKGPISVYTKGGQLYVDFEMNKGSFENVHLIGPTEHVFSGQIKI